MKSPSQPSEIAREVLRLLTLRRKAPTPDNYAALYNEIAGTMIPEVFPEKPMVALLATLPRETPDQNQLTRQIETAIKQKDWEDFSKAINTFVRAAAPRTEVTDWPHLINTLITQLERNQAHLTAPQKYGVLKDLLENSVNPGQIHAYLQSQLQSWEQLPEAPLPSGHGSTSPERSSASEKRRDSSLPFDISQNIPESHRAIVGWIAMLLDNAIGTLLVDAPDLAEESHQLSIDIRTICTPDNVASFTARLKKFSYRLQFVAEDQAELRTALQHLIRLIIENIGEVVIDDRPLHGQIATLLDLMNKPLSLRHIDNVERHMKDVIFKQSMLKKQIIEAQNRFKGMLIAFVDRLANLTAETDAFHTQIESSSQKISQATDISQISEVLGEIMQASRNIQTTTRRSHDEMKEMQTRVVEAEKEIERLQAELNHASGMIRQDPLTGVLNRKGMDEALEREVARFTRHLHPLCLALLDIDNFKKLNDSLGHQAGDAALVHLANVVRETIRPQDTLARYGGEEFVILLPDTPLDEAVTTVIRLQRELTRKFFMHNNEKILITFSAGVAEMSTDEPSEDTLKRADQAMYLAKRAGKNRVIAA